MMAPSRRLEQRMDIIKYLEDVYSTYVTIKFFGTLTKSTNTDLLSLGTFIIIL